MDKKRILFADNDVFFLNTRKEFLEIAGYDVITAGDPNEAENILRQGRLGKLDLAILDIRLIEDDDDQDTSGLELAKRSDHALPKIMLTGFPTWEAASEALGQDITGLPPAVDFIAKEEGPQALLRSVQITLERPLLKQNLLTEFNAPSTMALLECIGSISADESASRLRNSFDRTTEEISQQRQWARERADGLHKLALGVQVLGLLVILAGILLYYAGLINSAALPAIAGVVGEAISVLVFKREDQAHKQVDAYIEKLDELNKLGSILAIVDTIESKEKREKMKQKVIDKILSKWFGSDLS